MVNRKKQDLLTLSAWIAGILLVNVLSSAWFFRLDLTAEKRFSLSPLTKKTVSSLVDKVDVVIYLDGDFPAGFKRLQSSTRDLLNELKAYSGGSFQFDFVNPSSGSEEQRNSLYQKLSEQGIEPMQVGVPKEGGVSQILVYPAALINYRGKQVAVSLLPARSGAINQEILNHASENLEYTFVSGMKKVMSEGKPLIGITEGHGELDDVQLFDAMNSLASGFDVRRVNLAFATIEGLQRMKMLVIAKPESAFTESEKFKIDYFVMHGGRVLWALDNVTAELDSLRRNGSELTNPKKLNLDDLLFTYGARINYELVADMHCASIPLKNAGENGMQLFPWLYYPIFVPTSSHPIVKNLDGIRSEFTNTVDTIATKNVHKEVILSSSQYSRTAPSPGMVSLKMIGQEANPADFRFKELPVAVLLEGNFQSAFSGRPVPSDILHPGKQVDKSPFTKMIVIGDGDILKNAISGRDGSAFPLGYDAYSGQQYGNKSFLLNIADYLTDDSGLISLRNKDIQVRLLDRPRIRESKTFWQSVNIVVPLAILFVAAAFQHFYRRRKFATR